MPSPSIRPSFNLLRRRRSEDPSPSSPSLLDPAAYGSASAFATAYRPQATRRPIPPMGDPPSYASLGLAGTRPAPAVNTTATAEPEKITYEPGPELPFLLGVLVTVLVLYGMGWLANGNGDECAGLRADIAVVYERVEAIQNKL